MRLMLGAINGNYLTNITLNAAAETQQVLAAVAYSTEINLLFDWCWDNKIPIIYYGRLDDGVAVRSTILSTFLSRKSPLFQCHLVQHHHAKIIWWREHGLYIGSANLTANAWYKNIEAGCFFPESEITDEMAEEILGLFDILGQNATPLTEELLEIMKERERRIAKSEPPADEFWNSPSLNKWTGLVTTAKEKAKDRQRAAFLKEWHETLQQLRDIGELVSKPENRPPWIKADAPAGAQADQFLHAHYYQRTFDGRRALYVDHFERNRLNPEAALQEAVNWWRGLTKAPTEEDVMLNSTAPMLREALAAGAIDAMSYGDFRNICMGVHAIKGYARRVANGAVGLLHDGTRYTIPEKVDALSKRIWSDRSAGGHDVRGLLRFILYGGSEAQLPERLWAAVHDSKWKIEGLGISALGELIGWALPDRFPPRNGRTSKSLKSLGYNVTVHVGG